MQGGCRCYSFARFYIYAIQIMNSAGMVNAYGWNVLESLNYYCAHGLSF